MNTWFGNQIGMRLQSLYKHPINEELMAPHLMHVIAITFKFGGKDTDGDGVYNTSDACPEIFGLSCF